MPRSIIAFILLLLSVTLIGPVPASAQPVEVPPTWGGDIWSRPRLTGSWDGLRDYLGRSGVVFDMDLLWTPQGVLSGGKETGAELWGTATFTLNVDTGKLGAWPGGFFKITFETTFGNTVFKNSGALLPVNASWLLPEFNTPATGLENATFMQFLSTKFGLFGGKISTLDLGAGEFAGNYRTQFMNTAMALPAAGALIPLSAFGGGIIFLPSKDIILSALVIDPSGTVTNNDVSEAFNDGAMVLASGAVTINPFGLVGRQSVMGMWSNKSRVSLIQDPSNIARFLLFERFPRLGDPGPILTRILERHFPNLLVPVQPLNRENDTWAIIYSFDQYLWQPAGDPKRGIGIFFNFGAADGRTNPVQYSYSVGIAGKGVVPGRPRDTFGIGWARTQFSDNLVPFLSKSLDLGLKHEDVLEMYYNASITPWLNVTFDLQVINPGLKKNLDSNGNLTNVNTVVVAGLRTYIRF